jgi:hypothetical protein
MKTGLRRHLTPGNAVAMAALVVALGGTAVAQVALPDGSVTTAKLNNGSVTAVKIANTAVKSAKIAKSAVKSAKIANGAVGAKKISTSAVTSAKIANAAVTSAKIADQTITTADIAPGVLGGVGKVTVVNGPQVRVSVGPPGTAQAVCPAGQLAISGGYDLGESGVLRQAGPTPQANPQAWTVTAQAEVVSTTIQATAVCVAP